MSETRGDYSYLLEIPTRWNDKDMLGHVNNVFYYSYFEAIITKFVQEELKCNWAKSDIIPYAAENLCRFKKPLRFPEVIEGAMRISQIGRTSFVYELAIFSKGQDRPAATGYWVHVMVNRESERPIELTKGMRGILAKFLVT